MTEVKEKKFEVNANKDNDSIDHCDYTQDTSPASAPPQSQRFQPPY